MDQYRTKKDAYGAGYEAGYAAAREHYEAKMASDAKRYNLQHHQLDLMKAVTQLVSVAGQSVQSLAQTFDCGPRS